MSQFLAIFRESILMDTQYSVSIKIWMFDEVLINYIHYYMPIKYWWFMIIDSHVILHLALRLTVFF